MKRDTLVGLQCTFRHKRANSEWRSDGLVFVHLLSQRLLFSIQGQKGEDRRRGIGRSRERGKCNQNISYEKRIDFQ